MDDKGKFHGNLSVLLKVIITLVLRIGLGEPRGFGCPVVRICPVLLAFNNGNIWGIYAKTS